MSPTPPPAAAGPPQTPSPKRPPRIDRVSLVVVTLVTALIWLFAESESLTTKTEQARIVLTDPLDQHLISVLTPEFGGVVRATFRGSAAAIQTAPRTLSDGVRVALGEQGFSDTTGEQTVDLLAALRSDEALRNAGLQALDVTPRTVRVEVERLRTIEDVEVSPQLAGVEPAEAPTIEPPRVSMTAPRSVLNALEASMGGARVIARLPPTALEALQPGEPRTIETRLALPPPLTGARGVTIEPETVNITLTVRRLVDSAVVPSVPVWPLPPPTERGRFQIEIASDDRLVRDVSVTGPSETIERFRARELNLIAVLPLSSFELERRITEKTIGDWMLVETETGEIQTLPEELRVEYSGDAVELTITPVRNSDSSPSPSND